MMVSQSLFLVYVHCTMWTYIAYACCHVHADLGFDVKSGLSKHYKPTLAQHGLRLSSEKNQEYGKLVYNKSKIVHVLSLSGHLAILFQHFSTK